MTKFLMQNRWRAALCGLVFTVMQAPCFAQNTSAAANQQPSATDQPISPAILKELEAMRHRIDELEAELKAQKTAQASTEKPGLVTAAFPVKPAEAAASDSVATFSSSSQAAAMASDQKKPIIPAKQEPFSDADWTWLNGNPRTKEIFWDTKFFTPEIRADMNYVVDFNHPTDHSIGGSSELFRSSEVQLEQFGVGGDFHYDNVRARLMTQFGMYSATTPRNDPSPGHGQWDLVSAYRYVSEAYGGYHFDVMHGVNVDAGIFLSYIGLFSYYNFDNWAYQPSYVSSNTPWFFNGVRVQIFPTAHLKIEPWFINGWQAYASANHRPGLGGQIKWTPRPWINIISNNYGLGRDDLFIPNRRRIHTDNSVEVKYFDRPDSTAGQDGIFADRRRRMRVRRRCELLRQQSGRTEAELPGIHVVQPVLVPSGLVRLNGRRRKDQQSGTLPGAAAAYQWRNRRYSLDEFSVLHRESGRSISRRGTRPSRSTTCPSSTSRSAGSMTTATRMSLIGLAGAGLRLPAATPVSRRSLSVKAESRRERRRLPAAQTACTAIGSTVWSPDLRKNESFIDMSIMVKF